MALYGIENNSEPLMRIIFKLKIHVDKIHVQPDRL